MREEEGKCEGKREEEEEVQEEDALKEKRLSENTQGRVPAPTMYHARAVILEKRKGQLQLAFVNIRPLPLTPKATSNQPCYNTRAKTNIISAKRIKLFYPPIMTGLEEASRRPYL